MAQVVGRQVLLILLPLAAYWNSLHGAFQLDDFAWIVGNQHLDGTLWEAITQHGDRQEFFANRPVVWAVLWGLHQLFEFDHVPYHAVSIAYHVGTVLTAYEVLKRMGREDVAFVAALLWGVHPITTGAVDYIVQMSTVMVAFWLLAFVYFGQRDRIFMALVCLAFAAGCRESAILAGPLLALCGGEGMKTLIRLLCLAWLCAMAWLAWGAPWGSPWTNRAWTPEERISQELAVLPVSALKVWLPGTWNLSIEHDWDGEGGRNPIVVAWWLAFAGLLWWARRHPSGVGFLGWFLLSGLEAGPVNLEPWFDHRGYLPSLMLVYGTCCLIVSYMRARSVKIVIFGLIVWCALQTATRNEVWTSEAALYEDAIQKAPGNWRSWFNYAHGVQNIPRLTYQIIDAYNRAKQLEPRYAPTWTGMGSYLVVTGHRRLGYWHWEVGSLLGHHLAEENMERALWWEIRYRDITGQLSPTAEFAFQRFIPRLTRAH